jgi:hypothetical protein
VKELKLEVKKLERRETKEGPCEGVICPPEVPCSGLAQKIIDILNSCIG